MFFPSAITSSVSPLGGSKAQLPADAEDALKHLHVLPLAFGLLIFSFDKNKMTTISSSDWPIIISAGRDLLDTNTQSSLFSITGTGGTGGGPCGGSAVPGRPPHMAHMIHPRRRFADLHPRTRTADQLHAAGGTRHRKMNQHGSLRMAGGKENVGRPPVSAETRRKM